MTIRKNESEDRISLIKRSIELKKSISDKTPEKLLNFVDTIEHLLEIKLKRIEKEINKKGSKITQTTCEISVSKNN